VYIKTGESLKALYRGFCLSVFPGLSIHCRLLAKAVAQYSVVPDFYKSLWQYVHAKAPQKFSTGQSC